MKRIGSFLLFLVLIALVCPLTAQADVIYEPDDNFYQNHYENCTYVNRNFTANGPSGTVTVYKSPESSRVIWTMNNGEAINISYIYTDSEGIQWGICEDWENNLTGWAPMAYLEVIYDNISFWEDYGELLLDEEGQLSSEYAGQTIYYWSYPGSETGYTLPLSDFEDTYLPGYDTVYRDDLGRTWGYISYYFGLRQVWICLDDPTADFNTLYPNGAPSVAVTEEAAATEPDATAPIVPKESISTKVFTIAGVAVLVVVTGVLLTKMKKKDN